MATVKQPKWKKATGTEGAISVKGGAYPVRDTGVGGGKVRGEVSKSARKVDKLTDGRWKKVDGVWKQKATAASPVGKKQRILKAIEAKNVKIANLKARVGNIKTEVNNLASRQKKILAERRKLIDMKNVVKAKSPVKISTSEKVAVGVAAGAAVGYVVAKKKKSPVVIKKKSPVVKKKKNLRIDRTGKPSRYTTLKGNR